MSQKSFLQGRARGRLLSLAVEEREKKLVSLVNFRKKQKTGLCRSGKNFFQYIDKLAFMRYNFERCTINVIDFLDLKRIFGRKNYGD